MNDLTPDFTLDELIELLQSSSSSTHLEDFKSLHEWAEIFKTSRDRVRVIFNEIHRQGKLVTRRESRIAIDGARRRVPTYSLNLIKPDHLGTECRPS